MSVLENHVILSIINSIGFELIGSASANYNVGPLPDFMHNLIAFYKTNANVFH